MPKFKIETEMELSGAMKTLGINAIFNHNDADFSPVVGRNLFKPI